jgi:hypothetical protein
LPADSFDGSNMYDNFTTEGFNVEVRNPNNPDLDLITMKQFLAKAAELGSPKLGAEAYAVRPLGPMTLQAMLTTGMRTATTSQIPGRFALFSPPA